MTLNTTTVIIKVTNDCNYKCRYCFLEKNIPTHKIISKEIILRLFDQIQNNINSEKIKILWHGGEPLLAGIDFFKETMEIQNDFKIKFSNEIQTNGSLIDDEFADFFKRNQFHVGLSIDGPQVINDRTRLDKGNNSTFTKVMDNIKILKKYDVAFGVLATISKYNVKYPRETYSFFKENGLSFHFNPLIYSGKAKDNFNNLSVSLEEYDNFLVEMGEIWLYDSNPVNILFFEEVFESIFTNGNSLKRCYSVLDCHKYFLAVGPTGELYPCCLFQGHDEFSYGNIMDINLIEITDTVAWERMSQRKEYVEKKCSGCSTYKYCYGGCPFNAYSVHGTLNAKDDYCFSYKNFIISLMNNLEKKITEVSGTYNKSYSE
jgi:uncharacterized protein